MADDEEKQSSGIDIEKIEEWKILKVRTKALEQLKEKLNLKIAELQTFINCSTVDLARSRKAMNEYMQETEDYKILTVRVSGLETYLEESKEQLSKCQDELSLAQSDLAQTYLEEKKSLNQYLRDEIEKGTTDFDINLSLLSNGLIVVDPNGIHNVQFKVKKVK